MQEMLWLALFILLLIIEIATMGLDDNLARRRSIGGIYSRAFGMRFGGADHFVSGCLHSFICIYQTGCGEIFQ